MTWVTISSVLLRMRPLSTDLGGGGGYSYLASYTSKLNSYLDLAVVTLLYLHCLIQRSYLDLWGQDLAGENKKKKSLVPLIGQNSVTTLVQIGL